MFLHLFSPCFFCRPTDVVLVTFVFNILFSTFGNILPAYFFWRMDKVTIFQKFLCVGIYVTF